MRTNEGECKALIFDLDGTLIDSAPDIAASINEYFAKQGWPQLSAGYVASFTGQGPYQLLLEIMTELELPCNKDAVNRAVEGYAAAYNRSPSRYTKFYDHVKEDLYTLHDSGFRLGICTNKPTELSLRILELLGVRHLFDELVGPDIAPASKPDPMHLWTVADRMGLSRGSWVYVGDTAVDQLTAASAGIPFYAVPWGTGAQLNVPNDFRLERLSDLDALNGQFLPGEYNDGS